MSEIARLSASPLTPLNILAIESDIAEMSPVTTLDPLKTLLSASEETGLSDSVLSPVKSLSTTSDRAGVSDRNLPADLLMLSEMADKSSESPLIVFAALETMSEIARLSASPLTPLNILAIESDIAEMSPVTTLDPLKTLLSASEETGLSDSVLSPVKSLSTTSDRAGVSDRNLPADLLMLSEMADKSSESPLI